MEDDNHSYAHDIYHIDYKNQSTILVHNLHVLLLTAYDQCNQLFEG